MCLLTIRPVCQKGTSGSKSGRSLPSEPPRIVVGEPLNVAKTSPVPVGNIDYAGGRIAGQAEIAKKANDAPPSSNPKKPSKCCEGKRRISNASMVSIRSLQQMKRKLEDILRRHQEENVKEQERWEQEHRERAKDRLKLEKLEKELDRERQRRRKEEYFEGPYRGWDRRGY